MSLHVSRAVWAHSAAAGTDRLVLLAIADHAKDDGTAWPGLARLSTLTGLNVSTVRRSIRRLVELGEVVVTVGGGRLASLYRITLVEETAATVVDDGPLPDATPAPAGRRGRGGAVPGQGWQCAPLTSHRTSHGSQHRGQRPAGLPRPVRTVLAATDASEAEAEAVVAAIVRERRPQRVAGFVAALAGEELVGWLARVRADTKARRVATAPGCPQHPGQLAAHCGPCRSERLAMVTTP